MLEKQRLMPQVYVLKKANSAVTSIASETAPLNRASRHKWQTNNPDCMFILPLMWDKNNTLLVDKRAAIVAWHKYQCLACERGAAWY